MTTLINADTSGGLKMTSDTSGVLDIQSAGSTKLTVSSTGVDIPVISTINGLTSINGGQVGGRRNIVINGEMKVAQRATSATGKTGGTSGYFALDRWKLQDGTIGTGGRCTIAQIADGPAGFANCLKISATTADTSIDAREALILQTRFEGQDLQQLKKGTASAEKVTVSFYVKGNAAALYVCELHDVDNGRNNTQSFAVTTDWNRIELTFAADTSDPLDDDNAVSLSLNFWLHSGSNYSGGTFASNTWADITLANTTAVADRTSIYDSTDRTFFLTGVQMEMGSTATAFESRSFGEELALCQRYFQFVESMSAVGNSTTQLVCTLNFRAAMRAAPTLSVEGVMQVTSGTADHVQSSASIVSLTTDQFSSCCFLANMTPDVVAKDPYILRVLNGNKIGLAAEL